MEYVTIIPAAGSSIRFKKDKLKTKINGDSILNFSIDVFIEDADCKKIILVVKKDQFDYYKSLYRLVNKIVVFGVNTMSRSETIYQGLNQLLKHEYVMIHDACRPYLTAKLVNEIKNEIDSNNYDAVIPVIPIVDSVIQQNNNEIIYPLRETLKRVQTPQCFKVQILKNSFEEIGKSLNKIHRPQLDWKLLILIAILMGFSLFISILKEPTGNDTYIISTIIYMIIGIIMGIGIFFFDYRRLKKYSFLIYLFGTILMIMPIIGLGGNIRGLPCIFIGRFSIFPGTITVTLYIIAFIGFIAKYKKNSSIQLKKS